jgi:glycosyltransferase involved in cell wall biosynthesis
MKRKLLLLAWEYQGYHSARGAALSRRIKQVANSFASNSWDVTVIHRDNIGETGTSDFIVKQESPNIKRIVVKAKEEEYGALDFGVFRRFLTVYYLLFKGDRTYKWAADVIRNHEKFNLDSPDLIISFFTPRGPLYLGSFFSKKYQSKFIIDFQDEVDQGNSSLNKHLSYIWTRRIVKNATAIVHVSPEWAERDGEILNRKIETIRHAVSDWKDTPVTKVKNDDTFVIFYGGSIDEENQKLDVLKAVLIKANLPEKVKFVISGHENTYRFFKETLGDKYVIESTGWLNATEYSQQINAADCILIIPWCNPTRMVIPSKFYEIAMSGKPIWIVGNDTGAFSTLLEEWQCPALKLNDIDFQVEALTKALGGDFGYMFDGEQCRGAIISEKDLYKFYLKLI